MSMSSDGNCLFFRIGGLLHVAIRQNKTFDLGKKLNDSCKIRFMQTSTSST